MIKTGIDFKKLPDAPGVYRFVGPKRPTSAKASTRHGEVLYVGKATSLRDRVKSYFIKDIAEVRSPLIEKIVNDAVAVEVEETDSVLEALILEAKLIKKYQPIGNTDNKDNKSWSYVVVTNETFPRVLVARERELSTTFGFSGRTPETKSSKLKALFGPFPSAGTLREALKIIRKIFPFFDPPFLLSLDVGRQDKGRRTSLIGGLTPGQEKTVRFNQSIGLYPQELNEREYKKTIRALVDIFSGNKPALMKRLEKEMHALAKKKKFEEAAVIKRKLFALRHIQDITLIKEELKVPTTATFRIEAYDTAHIRGSAPRGVMAVVEEGEAQKSKYRVFTIRGPQMLDVGRPTFGGDDYAALDEIITRRARHREWPFPQLVVIDGGKAHLNRAKKTLKDAGINAEVVSVVKDEKHRPREILGKPSLALTHEADILLANSEAHRFSIGRHRKALRRGVR